VLRLPTLRELQAILNPKAGNPSPIPVPAQNDGVRHLASTSTAAYGSLREGEQVSSTPAPQLRVGEVAQPQSRGLAFTATGILPQGQRRTWARSDSCDWDLSTRAI